MKLDTIRREDIETGKVKSEKKASDDEGVTQDE